MSGELVCDLSVNLDLLEVLSPESGLFDGPGVQFLSSWRNNIIAVLLEDDPTVAQTIDIRGIGLVLTLASHTRTISVGSHAAGSPGSFNGEVTLVARVLTHVALESRLRGLSSNMSGCLGHSSSWLLSLR